MQLYPVLAPHCQSIYLSLVHRAKVLNEQHNRRVCRNAERITARLLEDFTIRLLDNKFVFRLEFHIKIMLLKEQQFQAELLQSRSHAAHRETSTPSS